MMTAMVIKMRFDDIIIDKPDKSYHQPFFSFFCLHLDDDKEDMMITMHIDDIQR